jgi:hypothetical protein
MESTLSADAGVASAPDASPSLIGRAIAVFARPTRAWAGLRERVQWWFPMLLLVLVSAVSTWFLHPRAIAPMVLGQMEQQVADGQMPRETYERMEAFFNGPKGRILSVAQQMIVIPIIVLLTAVVVWFGIGFVLGTKFRYRLALEASAWSSLITIPTQIVVFALAWIRETMRGVHVGFGLLLPEPETPSKLLTGLGFFLDSIGPLSIWYVVVLVLGASTLSGAPRRSVAWVLGGLYLGLVLLFAALGAMFAPAA